MTRPARAIDRRERSGRAATVLWSADLDRLPCRCDLLSPDEVERSQRFGNRQLRSRYVAGRAWVRSVIGLDLGVPPADLRFRYLEFGKPVLDHPPDVLDFSLAHSGERALLAIGGPGGLGVDVERFATGTYEPAAASVVLSPDELRWIDASADPDRAFLRCWVRKEAYAKVGGMGMDRYLTALTLTGPGLDDDNSGFDIVDLDIDAGLIAAVALPAGGSFTYQGTWVGEDAA